jgi:hypothetical protein
VVCSFLPPPIGTSPSSQGSSYDGALDEDDALGAEVVGEV